MVLLAGAARGRAEAPTGKVGTAQGAALRVMVLAVRATYERRLARRRTAHVGAPPRGNEE
jgi:hypothetical protein